MRQYQPIWEAIKKNNTASIVAPISNHKRIIKAVSKEKYLDEGYKLQLEEKGLKAKLIITFTPDNKELISFTLETYIKPSCIGVNNL